MRFGNLKMQEKPNGSSKNRIKQKSKEMTLEDIEKALGYPVKIVKEK